MEHGIGQWERGVTESFKRRKKPLRKRLGSWISRKRVERKKEKKNRREFKLWFRRKSDLKLRNQGKKTCLEELEVGKFHF